MDQSTRRSNDSRKVRLMSEISLLPWLGSRCLLSCWSRAGLCKQWHEAEQQSRNLVFPCLTVSSRWFGGVNRCAAHLHPQQPPCSQHQCSVHTPRLSGQGVLFTFSLLSPCIILSCLSGQILASVEGGKEPTGSWLTSSLNPRGCVSSKAELR